jgi:hypothetical protein
VNAMIGGTHYAVIWAPADAIGKPLGDRGFIGRRPATILIEPIMRATYSLSEGQHISTRLAMGSSFSSRGGPLCRTGSELCQFQPWRQTQNADAETPFRVKPGEEYPPALSHLPVGAPRLRDALSRALREFGGGGA